MYYSTDYVSPLGIVTLASDGRNLAGAWFEGQKYFGGAIGSQWEEKDDLPVFKMAVDWLDLPEPSSSNSSARLGCVLEVGENHRKTACFDA
ncbi:MAG: hypothetical protein PUA95_07280 [Lactimicrobium massiliense]|nr:hypothetical protein [Lactimicrobium massiliense]MDD6230519.1 hypothetical protein [Lactimicrobium massiliense]